MKCPFCAVRFKKDEALDLLAHVALTHAGQVKALAETYSSSEVVWIVPTPETKAEPEAEAHGP